mmetsp:Transcript_2334/g.3387  ORF Transcript_2334/g.3387 Transcript_2334/m.3387 type:complete len:92 (+) Transcript_2334:80-355(+)
MNHFHDQFAILIFHETESLSFRIKLSLAVVKRFLQELLKKLEIFSIILLSSLFRILYYHISPFLSIIHWYDKELIFLAQFSCGSLAFRADL